MRVGVINVQCTRRNMVTCSFNKSHRRITSNLICLIAFITQFDRAIKIVLLLILTAFLSQFGGKRATFLTFEISVFYHFWFPWASRVSEVSGSINWYLDDRLANNFRIRTNSLLTPLSIINSSLKENEEAIWDILWLFINMRAAIEFIRPNNMQQMFINHQTSVEIIKTKLVIKLVLSFRCFLRPSVNDSMT